MSNKSHQLLYVFHLIAVKVVKSSSADAGYIFVMISFVGIQQVSSRLGLKNWAAGPFIWVDEFNVFITIFYESTVYNTKVPLIIRTNIKQSGHDVLNRKNVSFCWITKFLETPPETQFIKMFSPPGVHLMLQQLENLASKNGIFSTTDCELNIVTPLISLFANSGNYLGVRISSEIGLCELIQAVNLF